MLFNLPTLIISLSIGVVYFITELVVFSKESALIEVEKKYPELNERLRTVRDNLKVKNELVDALQKLTSTGQHGDGRIFILNVDDGVRIRDGRHGDTVL